MAESDAAERFVMFSLPFLARKDLTMNDKAVFKMIEHRIGGNGECWPSVRRIAKDLGLGKTTVGRSITALETAGMIEKDKSNYRLTNTYRIKRPDSGRKVSRSGARCPESGQGVPIRVLGCPDLSHNELEQVNKNHEKKKKYVEKISPNLETRSWEGVTQQDLDAWSKAFPACDVVGDLARMIEWGLANPTKFHKSNYRRFITNWLTRQQERGGSKNGVHGRAASSYSSKQNQGRPGYSASRAEREFPGGSDLPVLNRH